MFQNSQGWSCWCPGSWSRGSHLHHSPDSTWHHRHPPGERCEKFPNGNLWEISRKSVRDLLVLVGFGWFWMVLDVFSTFHLFYLASLASWQAAAQPLQLLGRINVELGHFRCGGIVLRHVEMFFLMGEVVSESLKGSEQHQTSIC